MKIKALAMVFTLALMGGMLAPRARADASNQEVLFRVRGPVALPGEVLNPGRYEVKLMGTDNQFAGVWSASGSKFYGLFNTIPVDRPHAGKARVVLSGSGKIAPKRVKEWFWTGSTIGHEFVYPANNQAQMAEMKAPQTMTH